MRVAVLWTGGKDSFSAYERALEGGHTIACLVTFKGDKPFLCHPMECIELQAEALGVSHIKVDVCEPYMHSYKRALKGLMKDQEIEGVVTGDIAVVDSFHGNWMDEVCRGTKLKILRPLWEVDRHEHLRGLLVSKAEIVVTCVMKRFFGQSWLGRRIDAKALVELGEIAERHGIDPCGERGEYHTMVLDSPKFSGEIEMSWNEGGETETLRFIKAQGFRVLQRPRGDAFARPQ